MTVKTENDNKEKVPNKNEESKEISSKYAATIENKR